MLDILMVTYRSQHLEQAAIASMRQCTDVPYALEVIDNTTRNESLTKIWNRFASKSQAEFLCFANPDIICGRNWASRLLCAFSNSSVVIASPSTPVWTGSQADSCSRLQALTAPEVFDATGAIVPEAMDTLGSRLPALVIDDPFCYGYCFCVRRDWLAAQGGFDEAFDFYGQDSDLNYRALLAGFRVVCVKNSVVFHYGQGSSQGQKTNSMQTANQRSFALMDEKHPDWSTLFSRYLA